MNRTTLVDFNETQKFPIDGVYKVVLIKIDETPQLLFEKRTYHCNMLENILRKKDVPFETKDIGTKHPDLIPLSCGHRYMVIGMGKAEIFKKSKKAVFFGYSIDYKINMSDSMDVIIPMMHGWNVSHQENYAPFKNDD